MKKFILAVTIALGIAGTSWAKGPKMLPTRVSELNSKEWNEAYKIKSDYIKRCLNYESDQDGKYLIGSDLSVTIAEFKFIAEPIMKSIGMDAEEHKGFYQGIKRFEDNPGSISEALYVNQLVNTYYTLGATGEIDQRDMDKLRTIKERIDSHIRKLAALYDFSLAMFLFKSEKGKVPN